MTQFEVDNELDKIRSAFKNRRKGKTPLDRAHSWSNLMTDLEWRIDFLLQLVDERTKNR